MRVATMLASYEAWSYRRDAAVPAFPDEQPVIVYDGVCVLCSAAMRMIATADKRHHFRFVSGQSPLGQALFRHYGLDPLNFETVLLIDSGHAYGKLDMAHRVTAEIGGLWRLFAVFKILPGPLKDWCYDRIALNRYRLFGRKDTCIMPDPTWRSRVIG